MIKIKFLVVGQIFFCNGMIIDRDFYLPDDIEIPIGSTLVGNVDQFFSPESEKVDLECSTGDKDSVSKDFIRYWIDSGAIKMIEIIIDKEEESIGPSGFLWDLN